MATIKAANVAARKALLDGDLSLERVELILSAIEKWPTQTRPNVCSPSHPRDDIHVDVAP